MLTMIKICFGIFLGLLIAWIYFRNESKKPSIKPIMDSLETKSASYESPIADSSKSENQSLELKSGDYNDDRIILEIEDSNQPPYRGFISATQNGKQLFTFNLPDGKSMSFSDSIIVVDMPGKSGTNLIGETFSVLVSRGNCVLSDEEADWTTIKINGRDFNKGNGGGSGAGSSYSMSYYTFPIANYCVTFLLKVQTGNPGGYSEPVTEIDVTKEEEMIETVLNNIKFN
jgi:hypothetical protein